MVLGPNANGHTSVWLSRPSGFGHADLKNPTRSSAVSDAMSARNSLQISRVPLSIRIDAVHDSHVLNVGLAATVSVDVKQVEIDQVDQHLIWMSV